MTIQSWLMYLTLVLVATATPGPAVFYIMTNASLHGWRKAVFAAMGNVAGLFPQFISIDQALVPQFTMLMATLMSFSFFFLMSYALLAHSAKEWLNRQSRIKAVNRASGSIFIGFGLLLATSSNK